ncbi:hypothetical protein GCM10011321_31770 [Youhaiella tibetensis]|uniref:Uncharacterized protein n=1 Tax=Paradevosia tibetensis TaxID=1447062 RepID=A0A5B9DIA4_9HYPH|nr:hypothetical protein [Youhaiella tibetensis]QEE18864.1 hypothetical protein FNA67_01130 [Youhaiella tibetensis]GGF38490.1 hypothetical protein GCM10011321_31770 [Youhaiella tibetensis]
MTLLYDPFIPTTGAPRRPTRMELPAAGPARHARNVRARTTSRFMLRAPSGEYVRFDLGGLVTRRDHAWIGFASELEAVRRKHPEMAAYAVIVVKPPARPINYFVGKRGPR